MDLGFPLRGRQVKQGFLDVGGELDEGHDLAHPWLGHVSATGPFNRVLRSKRRSILARRMVSAINLEMCATRFKVLVVE